MGPSSVISAVGDDYKCALSRSRTPIRSGLSSLGAFVNKSPLNRSPLNGIYANKPIKFKTRGSDAGLYRT